MLDLDDLFNAQEINNPKIIYDIEQGTQEWLDLRAGNITGSKFSDILAGGNGLVRDKYLTQLAIERLTGKPIVMDYKSMAMIKGSEDEALAREHYAFTVDEEINQAAFIYHSTILNAGCSPDALVGNDGLLEVKCPNLVTHTNYLLDKKIPNNYLKQMHWQLACTGRYWVDWVSYCKEMPPHLRFLCIRVERDESIVKKYNDAAIKFNQEVNSLLEKLRVM